MSNSILSTFAATLFALLNPLGMLPFFIGYTAGERRGVQLWLALFVSVTVFFLMLLFLFIGSPTLKFFGITLESFRVAGGILLLLIGIDIVNGKSLSAAQDVAAEDKASDLVQAKSVYRKIVIPMAMPLLVGPGVIANVILYASEAEAAKSGRLFVGLVAVIAAISLLCWAILASGRGLQRLLGNVGLSIGTRILGLLVAAMGAQFIITGLTNVIVDSIAPAVLSIR